MRAILIDDDCEFYRIFKKALERVSSQLSFPIDLTFQNNIENYDILKLSFDIYFIDINLAGKSGIELVSRLQKRNFDKEFVFVSAYENYIKPCMFVKPRAFIYKGSLEKDLSETVIFLKKLWEKKYICVKLKDNTKMMDVFPQRICYCQSNGHYVDLYLEDGSKIISRTNLGQIEKSFSEFHYIRIHNRCLVNLEYVHQFVKEKVILKTGDVLNVSRAYQKNAEYGIMKWFEQIYQLS